MIGALDAGLAELYPPEQRFGPNLKAQHLEDGRGTFLVARDDGRAIACGAVRILDATTGEIKRMYVEPDQRGRGVGRAVLARLEAAARQLGARRLVLERLTRQIAIARQVLEPGPARPEFQQPSGFARGDIVDQDRDAARTKQAP